MFAASGPRVAKGVVALLAVAFGAASGEMLAPLPANERATASCRAEAHRSVFELLAHALGPPGAASSSLCARVMPDPGLRCVIAAASTRCRLARAEVHARGACDLARADACEACVMRALAGASASREKKTSPTRASSRAAGDFSDATVVHGREETRVSSRAERDHETAFSLTTLPPAMEWQVYLAELDAVQSECRHAEDAWRAEAAASALAKVLEKAQDAEKAADARDAASRRAAEDVLAEVQEARAAAADASTKIGSVAAQTDRVAASMRAWRADAEAFVEAHGETLRGIETQSESMRALVEATATKVDSFVAFAGSHGQTVWATIQALRRDMSRSRDAIEAAAAAAAAAAARPAADGDAFRLVFVRGPLVALWRLARLATRSVAFAWRVVVKVHALLSKVVPARYRVLAGAAAAAAARRRRRSRENKTRARRESFDSFRSEHAEVLAELRALRRETAERALFEPRRRASARRAPEEDSPSVLRGETETKTKQKKSGRGGDAAGATTRARARR